MRGTFLCTIISADCIPAVRGSSAAGAKLPVLGLRLRAEGAEMNETDYVIVLTTLPADADVSAFAHALVDGRLAACVNLLPAMESLYRWDGKIEQERERQLAIKTSRARVPALSD